MLELKDFFHLPQVDDVLAQLVAERRGLIAVVGLDPHPSVTTAEPDGFLPSGRATIFRILARQLLTAVPNRHAIVVAADKDAIRIARQQRRQVQLIPVRARDTYASCIAQAAARRPDLLIVDELNQASAAPALHAARSGLRVLSQIDTITHGQEVALALRDMGVASDDLEALRWVVGVQRLPTLCPRCKRPLSPEDAQIDALRQRFPQLQDAAATFHTAPGCPHCHNTGRRGEVTAFDIYAAAPQATTLPLQAYLLHLAAQGNIPPEDVLNADANRLRRIHSLLTASERALLDSYQERERHLAELEAANIVLLQRTEALVSLQEIGQALLTVTDLPEMAQRICQHTRALCGAERAILYLLHSTNTAEILAVSGWDADYVGEVVDITRLCDTLESGTTEPHPFNYWPPGLVYRPPDVEGVTLRVGLCVPLVAQNETLGAMLVHSTQRTAFAPGHEALLQTFAQQAALAMQRAGLINRLRDKISQLEAAQAALAQKERMERELELARQVQQSVLPRTFPRIPGYTFAAHNQPARQVGGDFYDVLRLDDDHFGIAIADVSDKGMPAALYMALTRSLLLAEARRERSPAIVLANVNQLLLQLGQPSMFVTVFYGVVARETRRLTYARAGHDRPIWLRGGDVQELDADGMALGLFDADMLQLSEASVTLAAGERVVLYTDGLTDVVDGNGRSFDRERLLPLLARHADLDADALCAATFAKLATFQAAAEQFDDMTMLVLAVD